VPPGWEAVASYAARFGEVEFIAALAEMDLELAEEEYKTFFDVAPDDDGFRSPEDSASACRARLFGNDSKDYYFGHWRSDRRLARPKATAIVAADIRANLEQLRELGRDDRAT
jgi:hypothetical protein